MKQFDELLTRCAYNDYHTMLEFKSEQEKEGKGKFTVAFALKNGEFLTFAFFFFAGKIKRCGGGTPECDDHFGIQTILEGGRN